MHGNIVTTNNRVRKYVYIQDDDKVYLEAYGRTFSEDEVRPATDAMRAKGYDGYYPAAVTNAGTAAIVLRYFDQDGVELDGYVAGWWTEL